MRKLTINANPEAAADQFIELLEEPENTKIDFSVIPAKIGTSPEFWAKLVQAKPELIARVPSEISENKKFCELIDHALFFRYIPDRYLTIEDLDQHEANPKAAIYACGSPVKINSHDHFVWYQFNGSEYWFHNPDAITVFNRMSYYLANGEELCPELWTQELADLIWQYGYFFRCYEAIPRAFVKDEWVKLMNLYTEKRLPILGNRSMPKEEKLPEYWSSLKDAEEMDTALQLEEALGKCVNPEGYAVQISFGSNPELIDNSQYYEQMWRVIEPVISDSPELVKKFFDFFDLNISKYISDEMFNLDWIKESELVDNEMKIYQLYKRRLTKADSPVAVEKAKRMMNQCMESMKESILLYRNISEAEAEELLTAFLNQDET